MATVFDLLEEKQELIEGVLRKCSVGELQSILAGLTGNAEDEAASRIATLRAIQAIFDERTDSSEKGSMFLKMIGLVPVRLAGRISDIVVKGQDPDDIQMNNDKTADSHMDQSLEVAELMKSPAFRKDFKIEGKLGRAKDSISMITLKGQITEGRRKGYTDEEISAAIKRAVVPGEMKTILDSKTDISLEEILIFIESVLKEKSSSELFQSLSMIVQQDAEDPQSFLMRALELRQKCLLMSKKPSEVPYSEELVQTVFLKRIRIGLTNNAVKSRVEAFIERDKDVDDSSLIQAMNKIASEEAERDGMKVAASRSAAAKLAAAAVSPTPSNKGAGNSRQQQSSASGQQFQQNQPVGMPTTQGNNGQDIHQTVQKLAEQMSILTQEMAKLQRTSSSRPAANQQQSGSRNDGTTQPPTHAEQGQRKPWYACEVCTADNRQWSCRHCLECGELGHLARDCPTLN